MKRHLWIAVLSGVAVSTALLAFNFMIDSDRHGAISRLVVMAQFPGWFLCVLLRGFESATTADYVAIAIPINSVFYAAIVLGVLRLHRRQPPFWVYSSVLFLMVAGLGWITFSVYESAPNRAGPRELPASELARYVDSANFGYWGLAFFDGRLYASTNLGLLELAEGVPRHLYRFQKRDSVISGPWIDRGHHRLWVLDEHTHELLNFDGTNWTRMPIPTPRQGYYSRGDVLEGIRATASDQSFWIVAADVWSWDETRRNWTAEELPTLEVSDSVIGVLPIGNKLFLILRHELMPFMIKAGENFHSDTIVSKEPDGAWNDIQNRSGGPFFAEHWIVTREGAWVCTREGVLLRITSDAIDKTEAPAECDALSTDSSGTALGLFRDKGVYELGDDWKQVAAVASTFSADAWVYTARDGNTVAYSTTAKHGTNNRAHLWLKDESGTHEVRVR